jgi:hypothetical protein
MAIFKIINEFINPHEKPLQNVNLQGLAVLRRGTSYTTKLLIGFYGILLGKYKIWPSKLVFVL